MKHFITARIFEMEEPLKFSTVDICDRESDKKRYAWQEHYTGRGT